MSYIRKIVIDRGCSVVLIAPKTNWIKERKNDERGYKCKQHSQNVIRYIQLFNIDAATVWSFKVILYFLVNHVGPNTKKYDKETQKEPFDKKSKAKMLQLCLASYIDLFLDKKLTIKHFFLDYKAIVGAKPAT